MDPNITGPSSGPRVYLGSWGPSLGAANTWAANTFMITCLKYSSVLKKRQSVLHRTYLESGVASAMTPAKEEVYEPPAPTQPRSEDFEEGRENSEEELNFWAGRGRDGKPLSLKFIEIPGYTRVSEQTARGLTRHLRAVDGMVRLTIRRIEEYHLEDPEVLASLSGLSEEHSGLHALVLSTGCVEIDLDSDAVHLKEVKDAIGQRHITISEAVYGILNLRGYDHTNVWSRMSNLNMAGGDFRKLRNFLAHSYNVPQKPHNEVNVYRKILVLYRKAQVDIQTCLDVLEGSLQRINDPESAWVDMTGQVKKQAYEIPEEATQGPFRWTPSGLPEADACQELQEDSCSSTEASESLFPEEGNSALSSWSEVFGKQADVEPTGVWNVAAPTPVSSPLGSDIARLAKDSAGWERQVAQGKNVSVGTSLLEGYRLSLGNLKVWKEEHNAEWDQQDNTTGEPTQEEDIVADGHSIQEKDAGHWD